MRQYETFELAFSGTAPEGGEAQVDLDAVFTNQGTKISVKGFYAGNGTYKVRFYPEAAGLWQWKVSGVVEASGEEECVAAEGQPGHNAGGRAGTSGAASCMRTDCILNMRTAAVTNRSGRRFMRWCTRRRR